MSETEARSTYAILAWCFPAAIAVTTVILFISAMSGFGDFVVFGLVMYLGGGAALASFAAIGFGIASWIRDEPHRLAGSFAAGVGSILLIAELFVFVFFL